MRIFNCLFRIAALSALLVLMGSGCGYHLQTAAAPDATIEVPVFENHTIETGIETILTERILEELYRSPGWKVVPPGHGRYVLDGTITDFVSDPLIISERRLADTHRATVVIDVRFRDKLKGLELWRVSSFSAFEDYFLSERILESERQKRNAVKSIAEEFATRIRVRIQDTW